MASAGPATHLATSQRCAWCLEPFDAGSTRLDGRVVCAVCGVATTNPWPTDEELESAYAGWYRPASGRFSSFGDALLRMMRGWLAVRLDSLAPPGPILDVGAGDGALLDALAARGRTALGLEREATRADVWAGDLGDVTGDWAAIVFWHSLEHLAEPSVELDRAVRLLVPGGILAVALPNAASLQARLFGDRWLALDLPRHLVHLPAHALVDRLRSLGVEIERVSYWRGGQVTFGWLHGLVGGLPGHPDLYDAIRRPGARRTPMGPRRRAGTLAAAALLLPLALTGAAVEIALGRGGSVYLEGRRER